MIKQLLTRKKYMCVVDFLFCGNNMRSMKKDWITYNIKNTIRNFNLQKQELQILKVTLFNKNMKLITCTRQRKPYGEGLHHHGHHHHHHHHYQEMQNYFTKTCNSYSQFVQILECKKTLKEKKQNQLSGKIYAPISSRL